MELENYIEDREADRWADKFAADLFLNKKISVSDSNHVYMRVKKIILEAMLRKNDFNK